MLIYEGKRRRKGGSKGSLPPPPQSSSQIDATGCKAYRRSLWSSWRDLGTESVIWHSFIFYQECLSVSVVTRHTFQLSCACTQCIPNPILLYRVSSKCVTRLKAEVKLEKKAKSSANASWLGGVESPLISNPCASLENRAVDLKTSQCHINYKYKRDSFNHDVQLERAINSTRHVITKGQGRESWPQCA